MRARCKLPAAAALCAAAFAQQSTELRRVPADAGWDVVARVLNSSGGPRDSDARFLWSPKQRLEVSFENRSNPARTVRIVSEAGPNDDCFARIERMTATALVVSCIGEKWATYENHEYLYDPQSLSSLRRFAYMPFVAARVARDAIVMRPVAEDAKEFLRVTIDAQGEPRVTVPAATPPETDFEANFGAFHIARVKNRFGSEYTVIAEGDKVFALPQSDEATWKKARPEDAEAHLHPNPDELNEEIGPHQWEGSKLWFGKTFYNSEGETGVGGFGYFDTARRAFQLYAPPEIWRWSVSAILVEPDAVWLALDTRHEYGNWPGGLLRWDRQSGRARQFAMDQVATGIARMAGVLCIGTTDGLAILRGNQLTSYLVDRAADGHWEVAARNPR